VNIHLSGPGDNRWIEPIIN